MSADSVLARCALAEDIVAIVETHVGADSPQARNGRRHNDTFNALRVL
jgi:hypothetical protein